VASQSPRTSASRIAAAVSADALEAVEHVGSPSTCFLVISQFLVPEFRGLAGIAAGTMRRPELAQVDVERTRWMPSYLELERGQPAVESRPVVLEAGWGR
jgi:hypothetical protein